MMLWTQLLLQTSAAIPKATECISHGSAGPMVVTADCIDPMYSKPILTTKTSETFPVPHHRVSGHFEASDVAFNIYLPPEAQWSGRFFQLVHPLQRADAKSDTIAFGAESGAYTVQVTGSKGYRADAAVAKLSRKIAAEHYRNFADHIYGYLYGGSGGSFQTVGGIENTNGVWDGAVPVVQAAPVSVVTNHCARGLGGFALRAKADQIMDTLRPGGSGDPYVVLGSLERDVLREVTRMGVPQQAWEDFAHASDTTTMIGLGSIVKSLDPTYADDFWHLDGYLGTEKSSLGDRLRAAMIDHVANISFVHRDLTDSSIKIWLDSVSDALATRGFDFTLFDAKDVMERVSLNGTMNWTKSTFTIDTSSDSTILDDFTEDLQLRIDNRWYIALLGYHRHQIPSHKGFYGFDQFRDADGQPVYPQRSIIVSEVVSKEASGGGTFTGNFTTKMIAINNLLDDDAFPWHADWYRTQVAQSLGNTTLDHYRIWYNENANHQFGPVSEGKTTRLVEFSGMFEQALRDLSAWVEKGIVPPDSTNYTIDDSQVQLSPIAAERHGIQPVISLWAMDGSKHIDVSAGKTVSLRADINVPPAAGNIISIEWDLHGNGSFHTHPFGRPRSEINVEVQFAYQTPGTYLPSLRVTSQRNATSAFGRVPNLDRLRVVVH